MTKLSVGVQRASHQHELVRLADYEPAQFDSIVCTDEGTSVQPTARW